MANLGSRTRVPRLTLVGRAAVGSTALLILILVLLIATPVTVSAPIRVGELAVLVAAFVSFVALNVLQARRARAPLTRFAAAMRHIDLASPERIELDSADRAPELIAFTDAFNEMLDRLSAERRARSRAVLLAQERERGRIARALHDEAGQTLTAVALAIERAAEHGPSSERDRMAALAAELNKTLDEVRRIARELRPEALEDLGLVNALMALASRVARQGGVPVERDIDAGLPRLSEDLELVVYRVAQEALTNVLRHAGATRCLLRLRAERDVLTLVVADDGRGIGREAFNDSIGIAGMRERALLAGGELSIQPGRPAGTTVKLTIPLGEVA
jgi:two-component system sensor histidine kinase UhpB